jgi:amidase
MHSIPSVAQMTQTAATLGMHLETDEAELLHGYLALKLEQIDAFVQMRLDEGAPEVTYAKRAPGYRPSAVEDPFNAWMWKCSIEGSGKGLLAGKTVSYKDHVSVAAMPVAFGAAPLQNLIANVDATIVTRVLAEGGTIIGKNIMDGLAGGFGNGPKGDFERVLNPHNPAHYAGGSSAGSAAALAAGEVDISFGGDQGGSIRIPAAMCGVVGLKPTFGLVSHFGLGFGSDQSIDYTGPMARTVEDVAAALQATAGYDDLDPRQGRKVPESYDALTQLDGGVAGLRIGILQEGFEGPVEPGVQQAVMQAVEVFKKAGAIVSTVSVPQHHLARVAQQAMTPEGNLAMFQVGFMGAFARTYYPSSIVAAIRRFNQDHISGATARTKLALLAGEYSRRNFEGLAYVKGHNVRKGIIAAFDKALTEVDVLIMPTCMQVAAKFDAPTDRRGIDEVWLNDAKRITASVVLNTMPTNYTGHPALAVPCGKVNGLPVSMQLVGRFFDDALLLKAAYAYQKAVDWPATIGIGR